MTARVRDARATAYHAQETRCAERGDDMGEIEAGYRGTPAYELVRDELAAAARYRGVTTYQDIALIMDLPTTGHHMARETGAILDAISTDEVRAGRPMLSAVVVNTEGMPGQGFFRLAAELGRAPGDGTDRGFWEREREAVYEEWKRPLSA